MVTDGYGAMAKGSGPSSGGDETFENCKRRQLHSPANRLEVTELRTLNEGIVGHVNDSLIKRLKI